MPFQLCRQLLEHDLAVWNVHITSQNACIERRQQKLAFWEFCFLLLLDTANISNTKTTLHGGTYVQCVYMSRYTHKITMINTQADGLEKDSPSD